MDLSQNMLLSLPAGLLSGQTQLFRLVLRSNHIRAMPPGSFSPCTLLMYLDLASNQLESLGSGILANTTASSSLYGLDLSKNRLTSIASGALVSFPDAHACLFATLAAPLSMHPRRCRVRLPCKDCLRMFSWGTLSVSLSSVSLRWHAGQPRCPGAA